MTELQQLALDAIRNLGAMTEHELATSCLRSSGAMKSCVRSLVSREFVTYGQSQLVLTEKGMAQARIIESE